MIDDDKWIERDDVECKTQTIDASKEAGRPFTIQVWWYAVGRQNHYVVTGNGMPAGTSIDLYGARCCVDGILNELQQEKKE